MEVKQFWIVLIYGSHGSMINVFIEERMPTKESLDNYCFGKINIVPSLFI